MGTGPMPLPPGTTTRPRIPTTPSLRATPVASSRGCRTIPRRGMGRKRPLGRVLDVDLGSWDQLFWWMVDVCGCVHPLWQGNMDVGFLCWVRSRSLKYWCCNGDISDIYIYITLELSPLPLASRFRFSALRTTKEFLSDAEVANKLAFLRRGAARHHGVGLKKVSTDRAE